ncbi:hypothetical protein PV10_01109 [Exophiala mesophila]|uniref:NmrA-like domain-containing protein n=1 Tax=Exophiala mesophila TaxID=212818 RepID=A0A0D1ZRW8_EXOME|nr:uncharacterized protein PV10_01109 [Exophiala mesophila]KIV97347.1 hypothetical protein PV10_01109 [Exophiala mesophila]
MLPTKVALAGATGNLGIVVLEAVLSADLPLTVLTRIGGNSAKLAKYRNLEIKEVDFSDIDSMRQALDGITVVVSCLATLAIGSQNALIDASSAAGVRRFIPAEFGMDSLNQLCRELPVCQPKAATQKYLEEKSQKNPTFTWTGIANGLFLDWGLREDFILNLSKHNATLFNGGDVPFSATNLEDVATAVLGVIKNQEQTANRLIYIQSTVTTQNQLLRYAKDIDGQEWSCNYRDTRDIMQESLHKLANGEEQAAMDGFCVVAMFDPCYGGDFSGHLDNALVGLGSLDEAGVRAVVAGILSEA